MTMKNYQEPYDVTVLVALYHAAPYLEARLESIRSQTFFHRAHVVLLNCQDATDESLIYDRFLNDNENVSAIHYFDHVGLYSTWNDGIRSSRARYVTNANADDQWHPEYLERCINYLDEKEDVAIVSTGVIVTDVPNQLYPEWGRGTVGRMPMVAYPESSAGPSPMWRRSLHDVYGLFGNYRVIGDARFWESLLAGGERFGLIDEDLVLYYLSPESLERRHDDSGTSLRDLDLAT